MGWRSGTGIVRLIASSGRNVSNQIRRQLTIFATVRCISSPVSSLAAMSALPPKSRHQFSARRCSLRAKSRHYDFHAGVLAFEGLIHLGAITAYLTRIKYVDLQKCYRVKLGEALPWCYPASCSSGQTLGGASLIWAKAQ